MPKDPEIWDPSLVSSSIIEDTMDQLE
jgi:hypothetical protein